MNLIQFDPNTLYSLDELRERLAGIVELPTLLDRLGLRDRRVFKGAVWGWEVIEAARRAEPFSESGKVDEAAVVELMTSHGGRKGKGKKPVSPTGRLSARDLRD